MRGASILSGLVLSFFILIGTSGPALSAFLCGSGICGDKCPMKREEPKPKPRACCPKPAAPKKPPAAKDCECKLKAQKDALPPAGFVTQHLPISPAILASSDLGLANFICTAIGAPICFYSDSSPPSVAWVPDLGRAPPAA